MAHGTNSCDGKVLHYDQACLKIINNGLKYVDVFMQSSECYKCDYLKLFKLIPKHSKETIVQTTSKTLFKFVGYKNEYSTQYFFEQHGHYNVTVNDTSSSNFLTCIPPDDAYAPLKIELWILFILIMFLSGASMTTNYLSSHGWCLSTYMRREVLDNLGTPSESTSGGYQEPLVTTESPRHRHISNGRIGSIDAFRGFVIILMLFVNFGGGHYWIFRHAPWNGLTIADIVYPSFAFIMGMSLVLSISSLYRYTNSKKKVFLKVLLRSLVLIFLGVMLNSVNSNNLLQLRLPGVLQRLGLAYLIIGTMETVFLRMHLSEVRTGRLNALWNWITNAAEIFQWVIAICLLAVHSAIIFTMEVPGCPKGYIGPGGLHMKSTAVNCTGGAAGYIDRMVFQPQHMYQRSTAHKVYQTQIPFDPEGLLGVLTTSFSVFLGVRALRIYMLNRNPRKLMLSWFFMAVILGAIAGYLSSWSKEEGIIPINKNLWSVSFVMATGSIAFIIMNFLYYIIDYKKLWNGSPLNDVGKNALLIYVGSTILKNTFPWSFTPINISTHTESLLMHTWATCLWIAIAVMLSKNKIFLVI